ncbi:putative spermidine/putrescine transport system substrate-binding protein [Azospirillum agricola]|uniref:ABC transporter substrate-binding protein n=1 Tax=Azospirillum agricola TaxID=1720247 RepID=UPI001AE514D3|nr:ABC transporter substrate-binding protein [Azospirillum agricola]MBP2231909.1 putative spermidine/putrescine transport system substrate-binding protein [Azospirillum agricola]
MTITRRALARGAAGLALSAPFIARARAPDTTLTLASFSGVFQENYHAAVVEPFMAAHPGIRVSYAGMRNSAEMLGTLRAQRNAPQLDVVLLDMTSARVASGESLFEPIARESLPVLDELDPRAFLPGVAGPAVTADHLVLIYAPDRVSPAPTSWRELWKPEHRRKVAFAGVPDLGGVALVLIANRLAGTDDYLGGVDRGIALLGDLAPNVLSFDPKPDAYAFIVNGTSALGYGWNGRAQLYARQSPGRIAATVPAEGSVMLLNTINLVRDAPQREAARLFIAYALGAAAQSAVADRMFYAPMNRRAVVGPDAQSRIVRPDQTASWLPVNWLDIAPLRDRINDSWRRNVVTRG